MARGQRGRGGAPAVDKPLEGQLAEAAIGDRAVLVGGGQAEGLDQRAPVLVAVADAQDVMAQNGVRVADHVEAHAVTSQDRSSPAVPRGSCGKMVRGDLDGHLTFLVRAEGYEGNA